MKKALLIAIVLLLNVNVYSQSFITKAPARAQAMLDSLYHDAKDVWWYTDTDLIEKNYYAYFIHDIDEIEVVFVWHKQQGKMELKENDVSTGLANVPPAIIHKFDSIFPNAFHVYWPVPIFKSDVDGYSVNFSLYHTDDYNKLRDYAEFDWHGKLISSDLKIPDSVVPANIKTYLLKKYPVYKLSRWTITGDVDNGKLRYTGRLLKNQSFIDGITGNVWWIYETFDQQGNPLKHHHYHRARYSDPF